MRDSPIAIRDAVPGDRQALYGVCLRTGDSGRDATGLYPDDPDALGRYYVGPYLALEPGLALVLESGGIPVGYCLGALDSGIFYRRTEQEWLAPLRERHPMPTGPSEGWSPTQRMHALYHAPDFLVPGAARAFPAHLHIDLLPEVQGGGWGRRLMAVQMARLRAAGAAGVHLGMAPDNDRALGFYRHLGFRVLGTWQETLFLGCSL